MGSFYAGDVSVTVIRLETYGIRSLMLVSVFRYSSSEVHSWGVQTASNGTCLSLTSTRSNGLVVVICRFKGLQVLVVMFTRPGLSISLVVVSDSDKSGCGKFRVIESKLVRAKET